MFWTSDPIWIARAISHKDFSIPIKLVPLKVWSGWYLNSVHTWNYKKCSILVSVIMDDKI